MTRREEARRWAERRHDDATQLQASEDRTRSLRMDGAFDRKKRAAITATHRTLEPSSPKMGFAGWSDRRQHRFRSHFLCPRVGWVLTEAALEQSGHVTANSLHRRSRLVDIRHPGAGCPQEVPRFGRGVFIGGKSQGPINRPDKLDYKLDFSLFGLEIPT